MSETFALQNGGNDGVVAICVASIEQVMEMKINKKGVARNWKCVNTSRQLESAYWNHGKRVGKKIIDNCVCPYQ